MVYIKPGQKREVDVLTIELDNNKIDELIKLLKKLKENKEHEHFDDKKGDHVLLVHEESEIC